MPANRQDDFFGVGMMSANPYAARYQPVHQMRMDRAQFAQDAVPNMPQGWANMFRGTALNGVPSRQRPSAAVSPDDGYTDEPRTPDGRPYPYPGGRDNPQNVELEDNPGGYRPGEVVAPRTAVSSNIPTDLVRLRSDLQDFFVNSLRGAEPGSRYDPTFSREDLTLGMDPSWGILNRMMTGAWDQSFGASREGLGWLRSLMRTEAPQADLSEAQDLIGRGANALSSVANAGAWDPALSSRIQSGEGMRALLSAAENPSAIDSLLRSYAQSGVGTTALRKQALTGGRGDINPSLDAIRTQGLQTLEDTLADIREKYGAMGLGASSDVADALGRGASRGIADIVRQQSELAARLDSEAQDRILSAGGAEQSAMASLLSSIGGLILDSRGQSIQAGTGIQDSLSTLLGLYGDTGNRRTGAASALMQGGGTLGGLRLGNADLSSQFLQTLFGGANSFLNSGIAQNAAALTPGLSLYPQEATRLSEANLGRWYNEVLRQAQGPAILQSAMGYATNFPPIQSPYQQGSSGWPAALGALGGGFMSMLPWLMASSDRNLKEDIEPVEGVLDNLKQLPIARWRYKGDTTRHIGPMAQDFQEKFGVGDGRTIALVDVMGVMLQSMKELAHATT